MGTDVLSIYVGTCDPGSLGIRQAKAVIDEASENRARNAPNVIPSHKLLLGFLAKIKEEFGAESTAYLACFLQIRLWGFRDNLSGVEIRGSDGGFYDPSVGEESRECWYNRRTGILYISIFKTRDFSAGKPDMYKMHNLVLFGTMGNGLCGFWGSGKGGL